MVQESPTAGSDNLPDDTRDSAEEAASRTQPGAPETLTLEDMYTQGVALFVDGMSQSEVLRQFPLLDRWELSTRCKGLITPEERARRQREGAQRGAATNRARAAQKGPERPAARIERLPSPKASSRSVEDEVALAGAVDDAGKDRYVRNRFDADAQVEANRKTQADIEGERLARALERARESGEGLDEASAAAAAMNDPEERREVMAKVDVAKEENHRLREELIALKYESAAKLAEQKTEAMFAAIMGRVAAQDKAIAEAQAPKESGGKNVEDVALVVMDKVDHLPERLAVLMGGGASGGGQPGRQEALPQVDWNAADDATLLAIAGGTGVASSDPQEIRRVLMERQLLSLAKAQAARAAPVGANPFSYPPFWIAWGPPPIFQAPKPVVYYQPAPVETPAPPANGYQEYQERGSL